MKTANEQDDGQPRPLETEQTEDLISELMLRFPHVVFAAIGHVQNHGDKAPRWLFHFGEPHVCAGLAAAVQHMVCAAMQEDE